MSSQGIELATLAFQASTLNHSTMLTVHELQLKPRNYISVSPHVAIPVLYKFNYVRCVLELTVRKIYISFYQCRCHLLQFTELCMNTPNPNQFDTGIAMCVNFNQFLRQCKVPLRLTFYVPNLGSHTQKMTSLAS